MILVLLLIALFASPAYADVVIQDTGGSNKMTVDANGSAKMTGPTTLSQVGYQALAGRNDDGTVTGTPRVKRIVATESSNELRTSQAVCLWDDTFNAGAQNTSKYNFAATTQTGTQAGGFLNLNASAITTINTNSGIQTFRTFPLISQSETRFTVSLQLTQVPQANNLIEFGLFSAALTTRVAPTDGVFFRYNASAELRGVINFNGTETQTAAITAPSANVNHDYSIVITTDEVVFYIDGTAQGSLTLASDAPAQGQPFMSATQPVTIRTYHGGSAPSLATTVKVTDIFVNIVGPEFSKPWGEIKAGYGHMAYQGQNGGTMGTTALYANSSNPAATVPTNTTAALGTGLGGKFQETVSLAAGTDGIIQSYQNPVGSATQTPRNLIITGVSYSGVVTVVLAATALTQTHSLAYGHTAVSLATAEAASFTAGGTTKAPRRIGLGSTGLLSAAAVGTIIPQQTFRFASPIVVAPGEFVAFTKNAVSAAPATGAIMWTVTYDAYFE